MFQGHIFNSQVYTHAVATLSLCRGPPATRLEGEQLVWPKKHFLIVKRNNLCDSLLCTYCYTGAPCFRWQSCCVTGICLLGPEGLSSARVLLSYPLILLPSVLLGEIHPKLKALSKPIPHKSCWNSTFGSLVLESISVFLLKSIGSKLLPILTTWTFRTRPNVTITVFVQTQTPLGQVPQIVSGENALFIQMHCKWRTKIPENQESYFFSPLSIRIW